MTLNYQHEYQICLNAFDQEKENNLPSALDLRILESPIQECTSSLEGCIESL